MSENRYDTTMHGPLTAGRKGARWSQEEKDALLKCFSSGDGLWACATKVDRCAIGTLEQLAKMGLVSKLAPFYRDAEITEKGRAVIKGVSADSKVAFVKEPIFGAMPKAYTEIVLTDYSNLEIRSIASEISRTMTGRAEYPSLVKYKSEEALSKDKYVEALNYALDSGFFNYTRPILPKTQMKESTMIDKTIPFQQVSYIYGNNVADCSDLDLIAALKRITAGIKDLQDIAVLGADKYAAGRIKTLEAQKEQVLTILEKR